MEKPQKRSSNLGAISVQWLDVFRKIGMSQFIFLRNFKSTFTNKWIVKFLRRLKGGHLRFLELKKLEVFETN